MASSKLGAVQTDLVLSCLVDDFSRYGADALQALRIDDPATYLRLVTSLIPRELVLDYERDIDFSDLTIAEIEELISRARQNRLIVRSMSHK